MTDHSTNVERLVDSTSTVVRIERAALQLFATSGYHAVGIREIGARAGVSTSVLYHYAASKEALLLRLAAEGYTRHSAAVAAARAWATDPPEALAALIAVQILVPLAHPDMGRLLQQATTEAVLAGDPQVTEAWDRTNGSWDEVLAQGARDGYFTFGDGYLTRMLLIRASSRVPQWYSPTDGLEPEHLVREFADLGLGTVRARRDGRELRVGDLSGFDLEALRALVAEAFIGVRW